MVRREDGGLPFFLFGGLLLRAEQFPIAFQLGELPLLFVLCVEKAFPFFCKGLFWQLAANMLLIERHELLLLAADIGLHSLHPCIDGAALGGVTLKLPLIGLKTGVSQPALHIDRTDENSLQVGIRDTDLGTVAFRYIAR